MIKQKSDKTAKSDKTDSFQNWLKAIPLVLVTIAEDMSPTPINYHFAYNVTNTWSGGETKCH